MAGALNTRTRLVNASTRALGAAPVVTIVVNEANSSVTTFALIGVRAFVSKIIRRSLGEFVPYLDCGVLTVRLGLSAINVLIPTIIASAPCRNFIPCWRALSPVIHFDSPETVAILPSSVIAAFTVTNGLRRTIQ